MNAPPEARRIFAMGADVAPFQGLAAYSAFGVQFRYEAFEDDDEDPLDRPKVIQEVGSLIRAVEARLLS